MENVSIFIFRTAAASAKNSKKKPPLPAAEADDAVYFISPFTAEMANFAISVLSTVLLWKYSAP